MKNSRNKKHTAVAVLACSFAMALPFAARAATEQAGTDHVTLEQSGTDGVAVTVGMDHAHEEAVTAVSLTLQMEVEKGKEDISFSFPSELEDAVTGYRYADGYLYLYVASSEGIFDSDDELYLGELTADAKTSAGLTAMVSYVDGTFQTANAAYGGKNVRPALENLIHRIPEIIPAPEAAPVRAAALNPAAVVPVRAAVPAPEAAPVPAVVLDPEAAPVPVAVQVPKAAPVPVAVQVPEAVPVRAAAPAPAVELALAVRFRPMLSKATGDRMEISGTLPTSPEKHTRTPGRLW